MAEVPEWLLFDQQDVHDTLVATSKHKPHLIADMAAMANVPGLANGQARRPVVMQTQQYASQVGLISMRCKLVNPFHVAEPRIDTSTFLYHRTGLHSRFGSVACILCEPKPSPEISCDSSCASEQQAETYVLCTFSALA